MTDAVSENRRPRVLLIAHSCSPEKGSEAAVGFHRARWCAEHFDTWVICEKRLNQAALERYQAAHGPLAGLQFVFVPTRRWEDLLWDIPGMGYVSYNLWHRRAYRVAQRLHAELNFDLAHQVNYCSYREPGYLWKLGIPFVWGPVGGTQNYPWRFLSEAGFRGAVSESCRTIANRLQLRFSRRLRRAAHAAASGNAMLAANTTIQRDLSRALGVTPRVQLETGLPQRAASTKSGPEPGRPLRILWSGELEPWKALSLLIKALALLPAETPYELRVLGKGSQQQRLKKLAQRLGVDRHTTWMGWLPFSEVQHQYAWADLLVFTSLRDTSGNVVLEALAAGLPVIVLDHQGMADIVTERCGIKVPVSTPREVVAGISRGIAQLAADPALWRQLAEGALERADHYLWSRQGARMEEVYRPLLKSEPMPAATTWRRDARETLRDAGKWAVGTTGQALDRLCGPRTGQGFGILLYHRIAERTAGIAAPTMNVEPHRFREQLTALLEAGFTPWPLERVLAACQSGTAPPPRTFVVTFDDGFQCVYEHAWPVLRELQIPATIFLSTAYLDQDEPFPFDPWGQTYRGQVSPVAFRPLSLAQCREMQASGLIQLGAHTHTHQDFRGRADALQHDLQTCVRFLQEHLAVAEPAFAFPFGKSHTGYASEEMKAAVRATGVSCALTTDPQLVQPGDDPFGWGRFNVYGWDTGRTVMARLDGWYSWAGRFQQFWSTARLRRSPHMLSAGAADSRRGTPRHSTVRQS